MNRDRFFTVHNVWGASIGTAVVDHYSKSYSESKEDNLIGEELDQANNLSIDSSLRIGNFEATKF